MKIINSLILLISGASIGLVASMIYRHLLPRMAKNQLIAEETIYFHDDFGKKIEELEDNPSMTNKDWEEIFEIAKFADERFLIKHPNTMEFVSLANIVDEILEERKEK